MPRMLPTGPPKPPQLLGSDIRASLQPTKLDAQDAQLLGSDIRASPQPTKLDAQDAMWLGGSAVEKGSPGIEDRARIANLEQDDRQRSERTFTTGLFVAQKPPYTVYFLLVNEYDACPLLGFSRWVVGQCWF